MASATLPTIPVHQAHTITAPGHVITRAPSGIQLPSTSSSIASVAIRSLIKPMSYSNSCLCSASRALCNPPSRPHPWFKAQDALACSPFVYQYIASRPCIDAHPWPKGWFCMLCKEQGCIPARGSQMCFQLINIVFFWMQKEEEI